MTSKPSIALNARTFNARTIAKAIAVVCGMAALTSAAFAQASPVSYSSASELNQLVANLEQVSQATQADLSHLRIEKWKADGRAKHDTESKVESIQKNLQNALPGMLGDLKNSPESLPQTFKVYHNLVALYDFMTYVVDSAGAFGNKDEFQAIGKDMDALEDSRHAFADRMDKLAAAKENELAQLRTALQTARAEAPPKKTVVDDTAPAPAKKPAPRKKPAPKPNPAKTQTPPPSSTPPPQ
jgi:hypothetical protein